jgi:hypothetical protein
MKNEVSPYELLCESDETFLDTETIPLKTLDISLKS